VHTGMRSSVCAPPGNCDGEHRGFPLCLAVLCAGVLHPGVPGNYDGKESLHNESWSKRRLVAPLHTQRHRPSLILGSHDRTKCDAFAFKRKEAQRCCMPKGNALPMSAAATLKSIMLLPLFQKRLGTAAHSGAPPFPSLRQPQWRA